jgi:hypothetical protein
MLLRSLTTALVALTVTAAPADACGPRGVKVLRATDRIVITYRLVHDPGGPGQLRRHYACARGSARAHVLDDPAADDDEYGELYDRAYRFRTNRAYLAYARTAGDADGNYAFAEVVVLNTRTGRRRITRALPDDAEQFNFVRDLVITSTGRVAWIAAEGTPYDAEGPWEVRRPRRKQPRNPILLDRGTRISPRSLRLRGGRVTWRYGSARRSAVL